MASAEAEQDMADMGWDRCPGCGTDAYSCWCRECEHPDCDEYGEHVEPVRGAGLDLCPAHSDYLPDEE